MAPRSSCHLWSEGHRWVMGKLILVKLMIAWRCFVVVLSFTLKRQTFGKRLYLNVGLMFSLCASLFLCVLCFGAFWCPFLVLHYLRVCVAPLIVMVSPSLCLHSRSRLSASSSSNSWLPLEARGLVLLLCCWVPGTLTPRAREEWSNQASSESAARWLVCHRSLNVKKTIRVGTDVIHSSRLEA